MRAALIVCEDTPLVRRLRARLDELAPGAVAALPAGTPTGGIGGLGDGDAPRMAIDSHGPRWNGIGLGSLEAVFVAGFVFENPVLPPAEPFGDASLWQARHVLRQQSWSFLYSLLARIEAAGPRVYNPLSALTGAFAPGDQLNRLRAAGLATPPLLCTNEPERAAAFSAAHPIVVWRPATGHAAWQIFRQRQRDALVGPDKPPVLLAAAPEGPIVVAVVVDGVVALAYDLLPPTDTALERFEVVRPVDPQHVLGMEVATQAVATLGLRWAAVTLVAAEGGAVVVDVDPDPRLDDLGEAAAGRAADALAHALLGRPIPPAAIGPATERPTLLLRRMLRVQFDLERSKHAP